MSTSQLNQLRNLPRLVLTSNLQPCDGTLVQLPTFQDIGNSVYITPAGHQNGIIDTHGSVANRLEDAIWDSSKNRLIQCCANIPYVRAITPNGILVTSSVKESHRLNSPYIFNSKMDDGTQFEDHLGGLLQSTSGRSQQYAKVFAQYDPLSLIHGTFMSFSKKFIVNGSGIKVTRALSGFIEGINITPAEHGTQRQDQVHSAQKKADGSGGYGVSKDGYGTLQASATLWSCEQIKASFFLDIDLLHSYALGDTFVDWAIALSLFKVMRFLDRGLRLRSKCILMTDDGYLTVTLPASMRGSYFDSIGMDQDVLSSLVEVLTMRLVDDGVFGEPLTLINDFVSMGEA